MSKLTLPDIGNFNSEGITRINSNNALIEGALENTISRDGSTPNHMLADLDMNFQDIINGGVIDALSFSINGSEDFASLIEQATEAAEAAEADRILAQAAAAAAVAAAGSNTSTKTTVAEILADEPALDPDYYRVAFFNDEKQIGSGGLWVQVGADPMLAPGAAIQNGNGTWYLFASEWLAPENFVEIGVSPAQDTAGWVAVVSLANFRAGKVKIKLNQPVYEILGATAGQNFTTFDTIWIRGTNNEVYQMSYESQTFKFLGPSTPAFAKEKVKITNVTFVGYAEQQIDAMITPDEIDFDSSSGNNVAAVYCEDLFELNVKGVITRNHAGRDFYLLGVRHFIGRDLDLVGLGPEYNDPIGDGHQGNGEDAAIYLIPKVDNVPGLYYTPGDTNAWEQTIDLCNSRIKWHSFCVRTILNRSIRIHGCDFPYTPGQHHVYDTDSDGHSFVGNTLGYCRQIGYKMQMENLAGVNYGPLYNANEPGGYQVGDIVRAFSIPWVCKTAYNPAGAAFSSTNWNLHPRYLRQGGVWSSNVFEDSSVGIGIIEASPVYGLNIWTEGYSVTGNTFTRVNQSIYLDRCWESTVSGNNIHGGEYGIFGRTFSGQMTGNSFWDVGKNCILMQGIGKASTIDNNVFGNYGSTGTSSDTSAAVLITPRDGNQPLVAAAAPRIFFRNNGFIHYVKGIDTDTADAPNSYLVFDSDTINQWEIEGTFGTPTTRQFRIDGTVAYQFRNHFPSYANSAQNEPVFAADFSNDFTLESASTLSQVRDVLGTLIMTVLKARRVTK